MVQDTLSAAQLAELDPDELLHDAIRDDRVLRLLEVGVRRFRSKYFESSADADTATLDPQTSTNQVIEELAWAGFTPNWLLSYEYGTEVANLVRFHYDPTRHPDLPFRQLHVRLFEDGTLEAHDEASALMHKGPHIREESFDRSRGTQEVKRILEDAGIDIELVES